MITRHVIYAGVVSAARTIDCNDETVSAPQAEHGHGSIAAMLAALREHVKATVVSCSGDGSTSTEAQPLSISGVVLPLLPMLATLGEGAPAGGALGLLTVKV